MILMKALIENTALGIDVARSNREKAWHSVGTTETLMYSGVTEWSLFSHEPNLAS